VYIEGSRRVAEKDLSLSLFRSHCLSLDLSLSSRCFFLFFPPLLSLLLALVTLLKTLDEDHLQPLRGAGGDLSS